jgi:hypothetical protein
LRRSNFEQTGFREKFVHFYSWSIKQYKKVYKYGGSGGLLEGLSQPEAEVLRFHGVGLLRADIVEKVGKLSGSKISHLCRT